MSEPVSNSRESSKNIAPTPRWIPVALGILLIGFLIQSFLLAGVLSRISPGTESLDASAVETDQPSTSQPESETAAAPSPSAQTSPPPITRNRPPAHIPSPFLDADSWNPFEEMSRFQEEMDQMFNRMMGGMQLRSEFDHFPRHPIMRQPRLVIQEQDDAYLLKLELPGASSHNIETEVRHRHLHIHAEIQGDDHPGSGNAPRIQSSFQRVLPLPPDADGNRKSAEFQDGVLIITVPRIRSEFADTI